MSIGGSRWAVGLPNLARAVLLAGALMTAPAGCGSAAAPQVTAEDTARARTQWPDATIEELEAGRRIFVGRCGSCHQLPNPARIASQRWPKIIADKRARANLSDEQVVVLERYLVTMAGRNARN